MSLAKAGERDWQRPVRESSRGRGSSVTEGLVLQRPIMGTAGASQ